MKAGHLVVCVLLTLIILIVLSCDNTQYKKSVTRGHSLIHHWNTEALDAAYEYWETLPSSSVVILDNSDVAVEWGSVTEKVALGSVSNSLFSALFGIHVADETIDPESTLDEFGISDEPDTLSPTERKATVRMLLQGRSGVYHDFIGGTPEMPKQQPERHSHTPGTFWYYNNWDFNALASIFEQKVERAIGIAFQELITRPIGMQDFHTEDVFYSDIGRSSHRQYNFRMTTRDLARFGQLMLQKGSWEGSSIIPSDWVTESTQSYSKGDDRGGYGYMWWIARDGLLFPGVDVPIGTFAARDTLGKYLIIIPERNLVVAFTQMGKLSDNSSQQSEYSLSRPEDTVTSSMMGNLLGLILKAHDLATPISAPIFKDKLVFLAAGRQGYGDDATREVALSMEALAAKRGDVNFTLLLGDNFYPVGVESIEDPQWESKFELLYDGRHQRGMNFYVTLGNHDHQGNVNAQLEYAKERLGSGRWIMDAPFYSRDFGNIDGQPLVRIVFLDGVLFTGIGTFGPLNDDAKLTQTEQIAFIRKVFGSTENEPHWKVIASHYSFRSQTGSDYSRQRVMSDYIPLLKEVGVDLVISANDRFQQVIDVHEEPLHVGTNGGGRKIEKIKTIDKPSILTVSQRGFGAFSIDQEKIMVELYDHNGQLTYVRNREK